MFNLEPDKNVSSVNTVNRTINLPFPHPSTKELILKGLSLEAQSMYGQLPIIWKEANDSTVIDIFGNKYIDFSSGIFVTNLGHSSSTIKIGLRYAYTYMTKERLELLENLHKFTGFDKSYLVSSGTEATEAACKMMRYWGDKINSNKKVLLSLKGAMHGRTYMAEMLKGTGEAFDTWIGNETCVYQIENIGELIEVIKKENNNICGVILEGYTGWNAGFHDQVLIDTIVQASKDYNFLICIDEIQSGFYRTGKKFAYQWYNGLNPHLICLGKALGNGIPISAICGIKDVLDSVPEGSMSSTHSANTLNCQIATDVLKIYLGCEADILAIMPKSNEIFKELQTKLKELNILMEGKGYVWAINLKTTEKADLICEKLMKRGIIVVHTGRETIKLGPPLTTHSSILKEGLDVILEVIKETI